MSTLRVQDRTAVEDVLSWRLASCDTVRLSKRSSFEPGVHGLALSALAAIQPGASDMLLECEFSEPNSVEELGATPFAGAFGFALSRLVRRIQFAGKAASSNFKGLLSQYYKQSSGVLGTGSTCSVVCPDPVFALPPALVVTGNSGVIDSFPPPSAFHAMLNAVVGSMGFRRLLASSEEASIVEFVYEAFRNSLEHGISADPMRRRRSTRALVVEKVVLGTDLAGRHLSPELKEYLVRIAEANPRDIGLGVVCFTVADQGDGIQATLPSKTDESAQERLARAFVPGESRKPVSIVSRGLGLPKVVSSAHHLQALVKVTSGDLVVGQDFSTGETKYPQLDFQAMKKMPEGFLSGTCVSVFVPEFAFDLDQKSLFGR